MKSLAVGTSAIDLGAQDAPFQTGYSVVVANLNSSQVTLQGSNDNSSFSTLATLGAAGALDSIQTIVLSYRYIKAAANTCHLLGN